MKSVGSTLFYISAFVLKRVWTVACTNKKKNIQKKKNDYAKRGHGEKN